MNHNSLEKLEFDHILNILESHCQTQQGKKIALELLPSNDIDTVEELLNQTLEATNLVYKASFPSFIDTIDISNSLSILEGDGLLSIPQILLLTSVLKNSSSLNEYFSAEYILESNFPILSSVFSNLYSNKGIIDEIDFSISPSGLIEDKCSNELFNIRKSIKSKQDRIKDILRDMIHSSKYSKYIQENIVTIRNDRFVIPIKEEYRSEIKGFIHDISNGGSTVFIEPISIFEINNDIHKLKLEEELEIEKILYHLSSLFTPYVEEIKITYDVIRKARFYICKSKTITPLKLYDSYY